MFLYCIQSLPQALETISWPQAMVTLGLAVNTTLSAVLLSKRGLADERDKRAYMELNLRLARIEARCYRESEYDAMKDAG